MSVPPRVAAALDRAPSRVVAVDVLAEDRGGERGELHLKKGHVRRLEQYGFASRIAETSRA
jgi:hypothetical protein